MDIFTYSLVWVAECSLMLKEMGDTTCIFTLKDSHFDRVSL